MRKMLKRIFAVLLFGVIGVLVAPITPLLLVYIAISEME